MDHAPPTASGTSRTSRIDRRVLVGLVLAGTGGTAYAGAGVPMMPWDGPGIELDSVQRTLTALAQTYDSLGPRKVAAHVAATETTMRRVFAGGGLAPKAGRDAAVLYAKLITMGATAALGTGRYMQAERTGDLAAHLAVEAGDTPTAAHAHGVVSAALRKLGQPQHALIAAHRGRGHAGRSPAAPMLILEEAFAGTALRKVGADTILECVLAAENAQDRLTPDQWGTPSYALGTFHPSTTKAFGGWALAQVGMAAEAAPRLAEAAEILAGTDGLALTGVRLTQARVLLDAGDVERAHEYAALAVARAEPRPHVSFERAVRRLNRSSGGAFADLVEQTSRWGFAVAM